MKNHTEQSQSIIYALLYRYRMLAPERPWRIYVGKTDRLDQRINTHLENKEIRCLFVLKRGCQDAEQDEQALTEAISLELEDYMYIEGGQYIQKYGDLRGFYAHNLDLCNHCLQRGHYSERCANRLQPRADLNRPIDEEKAEQFLRFVSSR